MSDMVLHTTTRQSWEAAKAAGAYTTDSLAKEGFIHCSKASQILRVANLLFPGQHGLVILVIDPARLTAELRWDPGIDLPSELFPHIYGPLNLEAVKGVVDFEPGADGKFSLPESLR